MGVKSTPWSMKAFRDADNSAPAGRKFEDFNYMWKNGKFPDGKIANFNDAISMNESPLFLPKVINNTIQEAVEPMLIAQPMLTQVNYAPGTYIDLPVMGAADGEFDVGETESYPTFHVTYAGGAQIANIGKQGLKLKFTEESLRYTTFPIVDMYLSQAAKAMARAKEEKIFAMWYDIARVTHDNVTPSNSLHGTTTGRAMTGEKNGTFTMDDLFEMYASILVNGYTPNVMFVHPLTWMTFIQDANLRHLAQMSGGAWFGNQWTGNPGRNDFPSYQGGMGISGGRQRGQGSFAVNNDADGNAVPKSSDDYSQNLNSAPVIPSFFGLPMQIIVSPFVPYDADTNTTTVLMADRNELGFFILDETLGMKEWVSPETDHLEIRLKERYSIRPKNDGAGMAVARNISVGSNQVILPAQAMISIVGGIEGIVRTEPV